MDLKSTAFLTESDSTVSETDGVAYARITRSGSLEGDVTVEYGVTGDTAEDGLDFVGGSHVVTMPSGVGEISVPVPVHDDGFAEGTESFVVSLISVEGASLVAPRTERIHIADDEAPSPAALPEPPLKSDYDLAPSPVVEGLSQPIRFVFSPADATKIYVAEKGGVVKIADTTTGESHAVLDWSAQVNEYADRGLVGLAVNPDLAHAPYLYAFMVMDPPDNAEAARAEYGGPDGMANRYSQVVRFTLDASTGYSTVVPSSEKVILGAAGRSLKDISGSGDIDFTAPWAADYPASDRAINPDNPVPIVGGYKQDFLKADAASHNGGDLAFGPDGMLYVATGESTSYNYADPRAASVQDLDSLNGKVLRIDPVTGEGLADNPFVADGVPLDDNRAKVYQLGFRNPFAITFDHDGKLIVTDTGWNSYEEIDVGGPGANFGWPYYEGGDGGTNLPTPTWRDTAGAKGMYDAVAAGEQKVVPPFRAFSHEAADPGYQVQAITSGDAVIRGGPYPQSLQGDFLFTDFSNANLFAVNSDDRSNLKYLGHWDGLYGPIDYVQAPDGQVWYADLITGQIGRLSITPHAPSSQQGRSIGEGSDALVLKVSQDAWNGNAEYTVKVDGVQVGGEMAAHSLHGSGASDLIEVRGDWTAGEHHTLEVSFLNDSYGGEAAADRNLYVDGIAQDGADLPGATAALYWSHAEAFAFIA